MLALAATTWAAAVVGRWWGTAALAAVLVAAVSLSLLSPDRRLIPVVCLLVLVGWWSGHASLQREAAVLAHQSAEGRVEMGLRLLDDPRLGPYGWWVMAVADPPETGRPPSVPMLLSFDDQPDVRAGDRVVVEGRRRDRSGRVRGKPYAGSIQVESIRGVTPDPSPWWKAGNAVRTRVLTTLGDEGEERALLAGFLVGEVSGVSEADMEAMRRSGLSHLVAVSGSNVALFLTLAMLAAGPLASGPRRRAVLGLAALVVFVVATRWEPSVVRASVMAALMLTGRVAGWAFDASAALGITVIGLIATFGHLATDVGFAMSVLATAGVLLGSQVPLRPPAMGRLVGATASAQLAVAPIVLAVFGSIPLLAPLTNLLAIPLVSAASALGAAGVATGSPILIEPGAWCAGVVLQIARAAAGWPQISWSGLGLVTLLGLMCLSRRMRPWAVAAAAVGVVLVLLAGGTRLEGPVAVVLDVGQGDAILVKAGDGSTLLVDGGPDPAVLESKLATYGVTSLDLVVLTHVHADHASGLAAVVGRRPIGMMWLPTPPHSTPASRDVERLVTEYGVAHTPPPVGSSITMGDLRIEVLAPLRRYVSPNDQSTVLRISGPGGPTLLLTGDIETFAQADLAGIRADIVKVPHQGGATSEMEWLTALRAEWAVISVGPNSFGHPAPEIIFGLEATGTRVSRTDRDGDVVVPLDVDPPAGMGNVIDDPSVAIETPDDVPR